MLHFELVINNSFSSNNVVIIVTVFVWNIYLLIDLFTGNHSMDYLIFLFIELLSSLLFLISVSFSLTLLVHFFIFIFILFSAHKAYLFLLFIVFLFQSFALNTQSHHLYLSSFSVLSYLFSFHLLLFLDGSIIFISLIQHEVDVIMLLIRF